MTVKEKGGPQSEKSIFDQQYSESSSNSRKCASTQNLLDKIIGKTEEIKRILVNGGVSQ